MNKMNKLAFLALVTICSTAFSIPVRSPDSCAGCQGVPGGTDSASNSCGAIQISVSVTSDPNACKPDACTAIPCTAVFSWGWNSADPNGGNIVSCVKRSSGGGWLCDTPGVDVDQTGGGLETVPIPCGGWEKRTKSMCGLQVLTRADCTACIEQ